MPGRPTIALALLLAAALVSCGSDRPDVAPIEDRAFVAAAIARCEQGLAPLRPDLKDKTKRTPAQVAVQVDKGADELEAFVETLRRLPVDGDGRGPVDEWFADWDQYVAAGREYADALRAGDPERYQQVARRGDEVQERISARARRSEMAACALDGVPLPERESPI